MKKSQIFYDPTRERSKNVKRTAEVVVGVFSLVFGVLIFSILINPVLPALGLPLALTLPRAHHLIPKKPSVFFTTRRERIFEKAKNRLAEYLRKESKQRVSAKPTAPKRSKLLTFFVNWDDASFTSLKQNVDAIDTLVPEWLHVVGPDGTITIDNQARQDAVTGFLEEHKSSVTITPLINNFDHRNQAWDGQGLSEALAKEDTRKNMIAYLLDYVKQNDFAGINVDFEGLPENSIDNLIKFMAELYAIFHPLGLQVSQEVPLNDSAFNYQALVKVSDYLVLMAYDEHWSESDPGPIASQLWYVQNLAKRFREVPASHIIISLGNYGYDWQDKKNVQALSFPETMRVAQKSQGDITLDPASLNPTFDYYDDGDALHHVWFLDAISIFNQIVSAQRYHPRGFALWRLGSGDPSIWQVFARRDSLDAKVSKTLESIYSGYAIDYQGKGEVISVVSLPTSGLRDIRYDQNSGLILYEQVKRFPSEYVIRRWGDRYKNKVALTFDDGPDPLYTPQILDILRTAHAPATFFVVGINAALYSDLLTRIVQEGHEIGIHTFTHPDISKISEQQLVLELNATQRLLESRIGRRSLLFRPPYGEDLEPETPDQLKPLLITSNLGYYTVGMDTDPSDWTRPGVDEIVKQTLESVLKSSGNTVLLHDSGGDRSQTVAALPLIIKALQARGIELTRISDLLGVSREQVMPAAPQNQRFISGVNDLGFLAISWTQFAFYLLFIAGTILALIRFGFISILAIYQRKRTKQISYDSSFTPLINVIIPAHNEERLIVKTVRAALDSSYPHFRVTVVDDGSDDRTYDVISRAFKDNPKVLLLTKEKSGKAGALNLALRNVDADIIIFQDADTLMVPYAIEKLVRHFVDPSVAAVAGNAKVGNRINVLTKYQALEYITSQNLDRRAFDTLNCVMVVPGAIGAWRAELVKSAGGFPDDTLAEDADLTIHLLKKGYVIHYEEDAIGLTEAPDTVHGFFRQRFRWMYGTLQVVWKNRDVMLKPRYGILGMLALPNVFIFQILFPFLAPFADLVAFTTIGVALWQEHQHPLGYSLDTVIHILFYYALFLFVEALASLLAFLLEPKEDKRLLSWLFIQRFFYRQFMYVIAVQSIVTALQGPIVGWHKVEHKATVEGR